MVVLVVLIALCTLFLLLALLFGAWRAAPVPEPALARFPTNPILAPIAEHWWESEAVFNPAAVVDGGRVHLFYRAMGKDGVSRIGYASSPDGIHFDERLPYPVYDRGSAFTPPGPAARGWRPLSYATDTYASGGGWGGCEDPRAVTLDGILYLTFGVFESWASMRLALTKLSLAHLADRLWHWAPHTFLSPKQETHKNWVLFPEKIRGKFALLHALTPGPTIEYVDRLEDLHENPLRSSNHRDGRRGAWDAFVRGAAAPPLKTPRGWLLFYHGMDPANPEIGYKLGAMLLDLADPSRVLYRSNAPILEPRLWYENDWKPGVVYGSGAAIVGPNLFVYYGGGDKYIAAAQANLDDFLRALMHHGDARLEPSR